LEVGKDRSTEIRSSNFLASITTEDNVLAIAGTGYGLIGLLIIILLVVLIFYFMRRA
jgi:cell division protein FtsW (lipid II flippase)